MQYLDEALITYSKTDMYPFHMPGHKQKEWLDITEIDGFDNLHHAGGILKEAQERAADLYGSERCFYLVNGSTCGLLAAISAAAKKGSKIIAARNSHKAVYHAFSLQELSVEYLYPMVTRNDLQGQITVKQAEEALQCVPDAAAVVITSPTYEGIISDIRGIADVCHAQNVPLIVDAAHGAHLGFGAGFPENPVRLGADAVIMSLHKTLPSLTQTALLHLCSERISKTQVQKYLEIFQTSSPSYLLMGGMECCIRMLNEEGEKLFFHYRKMLDKFYADTSDLKCLHVMKASDFLETEIYAWDFSKLIIFSGNRGAFGLTGAKLHELLRERYHLQMEMASGNYVLALTSIMDQENGFVRLAEALHEIDRKLQQSDTVLWEQPLSGMEMEHGSVSGMEVEHEAVSGMEVEHGSVSGMEVTNQPVSGFTEQMYRKNERVMQIYEAEALPWEKVLLEEAEGKISAGMVCLYPPGIPLLVPGEKIRLGFAKQIRACLTMGLYVEGADTEDKDCIFLKTILY